MTTVKLTSGEVIKIDRPIESFVSDGDSKQYIVHIKNGKWFYIPFTGVLYICTDEHVKLV